MMVYRQHACGCITDTDPESDVTKSYGKCVSHIEELARQRSAGSEAYYRSFGAIKEDAADRYTAELFNAVGELPRCRQDVSPVAVEIGCGASPYVHLLQGLGYTYMGVDSDSWAAAYTAEKYGVAVAVDTLNGFSPGWWGQVGLVLAAHTLEHMPDAPKSIQICADMLAPGGTLVVVSPNDEDLTNPDHLWFFNERTLSACIKKAGLVVRKIAVKQVVQHEKFIYCVATKGESTWQT